MNEQNRKMKTRTEGVILSPQGCPHPGLEGCRQAGFSDLLMLPFLDDHIDITSIRDPTFLQGSVSAWKDRTPGVASALEDWMQTPLLQN